MRYLPYTILAKSAFWNIAEGRSDFRPTIRMADRSISSFGDSDSEIAEWSGGRPSVYRPSDLVAGRVPEFLAGRISHRRRIRVKLTTPCTQQIEFEAQSRYLGISDLATMAWVAILVARKNGRYLYIHPELS